MENELKATMKPENKENKVEVNNKKFVKSITSLNLFVNSSFSSKIIKRIEENTKMEYISKDGNFIKVKVENEDGYVFSNYVKTL